MSPLVINGEEVERVEFFNFLGTIVSDNFKWDRNTTGIVKKCHQRLFFLRKLKKFGICKITLIQFYRAVIESVLTFSITVWYGALTEADRDRLEKIVFTASKIIGSKLETLEEIYKKRSEKKIQTIMSLPDHPSSQFFSTLPSGRRFRSILSRTDRFKNSFYVKSARDVRPKRSQPALC